MADTETTLKDIRETALYQEAEALYRALRRPGAGLISDAAEISTNGTCAVFTGTMVETLSGEPATRICLTELDTGDTRVLTFGPNMDRTPRYSPDGRQIAFLSDRHRKGDFQLYLLDPLRGAAEPAPRVEGWIEYLHWSPDGKRILLGVAGHGADIAGGQGAVTSKQFTENLPSWLPVVESGNESYRWRRAWVYELATAKMRQVSQSDTNIWEAAWCGNEAIVAVCSPGPREGLWYSACLHVIELETGAAREVYKPQDQLGWPSASASGRHLAFVEGPCSDRWIVAGDLLLTEIGSGAIQRVDTHQVDVTYTEWRSDRQLLIAGHRRFESVVGLYDTASAAFTEIWASSDVTTGGRYISVSGIDSRGDCALVGEGFVRAPEIAVIRRGTYHTVKSFGLDHAGQGDVVESVERLTWKAPDGLDIHGWLLRPRGQRPHPLILSVHGGPVSHWRPRWLGRIGLHVLMLLKRGYAVFFPNPRGSAGCGRDFARQVVGEMGGADTADCLSGVDFLIEQGIADPTRLGVTGISYGGFMTAWLITQDPRFAAAVAVAPITNHVTEHLISNIPDFVALFLADTYRNPGNKYFQRSPVMHAHKVRTPTLNICGALDRCTPPEEAMQFHNALLENGVESVLVTYPEEGHGIRKLPAYIDYTARLVGWFEAHIPEDD